MIINRPAIDWLTLTTFTNLAGNELLRVARRCATNSEPKNRRIMQYEGKTWGNTFYGVAEQRGRGHMMLRASGATAHEAYDEIMQSNPAMSVSCTRIDLQVTVRLTWNYSARALCDQLRTADWNGHKRKVTMIEGGDGLDTIYIGSRDSERMYRIYVKRVDNESYLRWEAEIKGDLADQTWVAITVGGADAMNSIARGEFGRMPYVPNRAIDEIAACMDKYQAREIRPVERVRDSSSTMQWVSRAVSPAVNRMLSDHDYGDTMANFILEWYERACEMGKI